MVARSYGESVAGYEEVDGFQGFYFEDSFVLDIWQEPDALRFYVEAVLTPEHPRFGPPKPGEQHCYRRVTVVFPRPTEVHWRRLHFRPAVDAAGELDWGNIDRFEFSENGWYELEGDWGEVCLRSDPPLVVDSGQ